MRSLLKRLLRALHLGEDLDYIQLLLSKFGIWKILTGFIGATVLAIWEAYLGASWPERILYWICALAIILAALYLAAAVLHSRRKLSTTSTAHIPPIPLEDSAPIADIDARQAYFTILDGSEWRERQLRTTVDTTNLVRNWLDVRLDEAIHEALFNKRLASWGEEVLPSGAMAPSGPIPASAWRDIEIMFDRTAAPRTSANWKVRGIHQTGPVAWAGIKFSRKQVFQLFPLESPGEWMPIHIAIKHIRERIGDSNSDKFFPDTRNVLRQAAYDGDVHMRGRKQLAQPSFGGSQFDVISTDIDRQYWAVSQLMPATAAAEAQTAHHTLPLTAYAWGPKGTDERNYYAQLLVNWSDIIKKWP